MKIRRQKINRMAYKIVNQLVRKTSANVVLMIDNFNDFEMKTNTELNQKYLERRLHLVIGRFNKVPKVGEVSRRIKTVCKNNCVKVVE